MPAQLLLGSLCLLLAIAAGCDDPLAERCYLPDDCDAGQQCSNGGDRSRQGLCEPIPDMSADADMAN